MPFFLIALKSCGEKGSAQTEEAASKYLWGGHCAAASFSMSSPAQGLAGPGVLLEQEHLVWVSLAHVNEQHHTCHGLIQLKSIN